MGKSWEIWGAILHVVAQSISSWLSFPVSVLAVASAWQSCVLGVAGTNMNVH